MAFTYEISTGKLFEASGALIAIGYSGGDKGAHPEGVNNPVMVSIACVGPIPPGTYEIAEPEDDPVTGQYSMPLAPDAGNTMYGRGGFRMHGDNPKMNESASEGCIIMPRNIREEVWGSEDHVLYVVVELQDQEETA